jgi:hypothetical protein
VSLYLLKAKQENAFRNMERYKWIYYILVSAGVKFRNRKKFRFGIPVYTGPFRALRVPQYAGTLTFPAAGCKECDLAAS